MWSQKKILRIAFLVGAIADAQSLLPLLFPSITKLVFGIVVVSGTYQLIMGECASLMLGWTVLLIWAYQKPLERKGVAGLTILVLLGLVLNEIVAVFLGHSTVWRMLPAWILQAILLSLFACGFYYIKIKQWLGR